MIGSDSGHEDASSEIEALRHLSQFDELEGRAVKHVLEDNPDTLYGLS